MLRDHKPFHEISAAAYDQREREREIARLKRKATMLGFTLAPVAA